MASAWEIVLVAAPIVLNRPVMANLVRSPKTKNMKNGPASFLSPPKKYKTTLKITAVRN